MYCKTFISALVYLYDLQLAFKFLWRLHYHTICSYQIHKSCSYRLFSLQESKQNDLRTSCSSKSAKKGEKNNVKPWLKRRKNLEIYGALLHYFTQSN